mgnify:FL=1
MANAKKCDRCGNYYDKNKGVKSINGCFVSGIRLETSGPYTDLDLCDSCISELYTFLGLDKEKNEK